MNCELCGTSIRGEAHAVNIDGGLFRVCSSCARLGTPARVPGKSGHSYLSQSGNFGSTRFGRSSSGAQSSRSSGQTHTPTPSTSSANFNQQQEVELTSDFPRIIKEGRELLGLSQEELGMKINEKPSVISHLETGSLKPSDSLARKLEHFLKIQLLVPVEDLEGDNGAAES